MVRRGMMSGLVILFAVAVLPAYGDEKSDGKPGEKVLADVKKQIAESDKVKDKVKAFAAEFCLSYSTHEILVKEVEAQNAKKISPEENKKIDKEWIAAEEELPIQKEKVTNACAKALKEIAKKNPAVAEVFVMDNQGAIVGENNITSTFYKAEQDKWRKAYNEGKGGFYAGKESFDKSSNATTQQISLPIVNAEGKVIGAVVWGVEFGKL